MSFNRVEFSNTSICEQIFFKKILHILKNMQITCEFAEKVLVTLQKNQSKKDNKYEKDILYAICSKIHFFTKNITTN